MTALEWLIQHGGRISAGLMLAAAVVGWRWPRSWLRRWRRAHQPSLPPELASERREGAPAVVEGTLRVVGRPCARFEDGAPAAAATLAAPSPPEERGALPARARAEQLELLSRGERIPLVGAIEVRAGSREYWPFVMISRLLPSLYGRLKRVLGPAGGHVPVLGPVCRSVHDGDQVQVQGAWAQRGADSNYRHDKGWTLVPAYEEATPWATMRVHALGEVDLRGPGPVLRATAVLLVTALAYLTLGAAGELVLHTERLAPLALATPRRALALDVHASRLDTRWLSPHEVALLARLHEERGDCLAQGEALYSHGLRSEAAERWQGCPEPVARWYAARALFELTEWERASDLLGAFTSLRDLPPEAQPDAVAVGLQTHLVAGQLERAGRLAHHAIELADAAAPAWLRCLADSIDVARHTPAAGGTLASLASQRWCEDLAGKSATLGTTHRADRHLPEDQDRIPRELLSSLATEPTHLRLHWPVGQLLASAPSLTNDLSPLRSRELTRLAAHAERLALYHLWAGRPEQARRWVQLVQQADEQARRMLFSSADPRLSLDAPGDLIELVVELGDNQLQRAEQLSWSLHDYVFQQNTFRMAHPSDNHAASLFIMASSLDPRPYASLAMLAASTQSQQKRLLELHQGAPRSLHDDRGMLDLLVEAHDEILLRRRLGLAHDEARRKQQRVDQKLADPTLAGWLHVIESARHERTR